MSTIPEWLQKKLDKDLEKGYRLSARIHLCEFDGAQYWIVGVERPAVDGSALVYDANGELKGSYGGVLFGVDMESRPPEEVARYVWVCRFLDNHVVKKDFRLDSKVYRDEKKLIYRA